MIISTQAIVLKSIDYLESSKLIKVLTKNHGLLTLIAKGAQKTKSKFGSTLQPMSIININYYYKKTRDIQILSEVDFIKSLNKINSDLTKITIGLMICESLIQTQQKDDPNPILFDYIVNVLEEINRNEKVYLPFIASQVFLVKTLGFSINFIWKQKKEIDYTPDNYVFVRLSDCALSKKSSILTENYIKMKISSLIAVKNSEEFINSEYEIDYDTLKEVTYFLEDYISFHLDKNFKYQSFYLIQR